MEDRKGFVEVRLFVADREQNPADLSKVTGSVILIPQGAPAMKKDLQLMMPETPGPGGRRQVFLALPER